MIIGSDVSYYQYRFKDATLKEIIAWIDFAKMQTAAAFTIVRAGQGSYKDICFDISWKAAKEAGLPRGAYWFYDSRVTPKVQAGKWASVLGADRGELPLFCDFEDRYGGAYGSWKHWYDFIEMVKVAMPDKEIIIYTGPYYWQEKTVQAGIPIQSLNYFKQYKLWIAHYGVTSPLVPKPWDTWTFWQYTDNGIGADYGVQSRNIDLNYFNGDENKFREVFNLGNIPSNDGNKPSTLFTSHNGIVTKYELEVK